MKNSPFKKIVILILVFIGIGSIIKWSTSLFGDGEKHVSSKNTILHLEMNGVIMNGKKFLKNLERYKDESKVKAILISINSPGGAVGPSQEIYNEIKRVRDEGKKPVICVSTGVIASGAFYSAMGCNKLVVAPGALVGSIGVIMEFANLEKLYDWAKVSRYSITSGKFKDSGAEYRGMRDDEKALFQDMINEVYAQFRNTVKTERKLSDEVVNEYADGRVFTGTKAVNLGFADKEGFFQDAVKLAAEEAKLGDDYDVFEIPKKKMSIFDLGGGETEDEVNSLTDLADQLKSKVGIGASTEAALKYVFRANMLNQPLYMMPGYF